MHDRSTLGSNVLGSHGNLLKQQIANTPDVITEDIHPDSPDHFVPYRHGLSFGQIELLKKADNG